MPEKAVRSISSTFEGVIQGIPAETDDLKIPRKLCNLPPLHSIATQVLSLSADESLDLQKLASVIEADPAFAAEVLFLANSPLFGFPSKMHVLRHAVSVLGLDRIKALTMTVAMRAFLGHASPLIRQCWRHSAACAVVAEEISAQFELPGDRAYTAALMHDIGRLGLLKSYAREVAPVLTAQYKDASDLLSAEHAVINVDHGEAGSWLVKTWAFPAAFSEICARHHDPIRENESELLQVVKAGCRIADVLGYAAIRYQNVPAYAELISVMPERARRRKFPTEEELRTNVEARLAAFEQ